jgi:predicted deacylase
MTGRRPEHAIDVAFPDLARWSAANTGAPYVWQFKGSAQGPHVTLQALTHGNEVCGAIALDWLLGEGVRPLRGTLTCIFANTAAYARWDATEPFRSRYVDEDFNRLWTASALDNTRASSELARARVLRPYYDATDYLLDLHSMTDPCPPLVLAGPHSKGLALARALGMPAHIIIDRGHAAGKRLRDYAFFDDPADRRNALLLECGQHWERAAPEVARQCVLRFLGHFNMLDPAFIAAHLDPAPLPPQLAIEVTEAITITTDRFEFALPVSGLMTVPEAGTLLARDGERAIRTPYADCVLIMPARRPKIGETAVRLGRYV